MRKRLSVLTSLMAGVGVALLSAGAASATGVASAPPAIFLNGTDVTAGLDCVTTESTTSCAGQGLATDDFTLQQWDFNLNSDPSALVFFALQNNTAVEQIYVISTTVPIVAQGPQVVIQGSISGSVTDVNGDGASVLDDGSSMYSALIDGVNVATLLDPPQSVTAGAGLSNTIGPAAFGPALLAQAANSDIGLTIQFKLSPGDLVSFTSQFTINAIPEPGTLLLLGSGLIGMVTFGRRSS